MHQDDQAFFLLNNIFNLGMYVRVSQYLDWIWGHIARDYSPDLEEADEGEEV